MQKFYATIMRDYRLYLNDDAQIEMQRCSYILQRKRSSGLCSCKMSDLIDLNSDACSHVRWF